jgi:hypothetical protein
MDAHAISAIQDKLRRQAEALSQSGVDVPVDWPATKGVRTYPSADRTSMQRADFLATVETLRQRSAQTTAVASEPRGHGSPAAQANRLPGLDPAIYQQCVQSLQAGIHMINQLSQQQEQVILDMQRVQAQLAQLEPAWTTQFGEPLQYPILLFEKAAVVSAACDESGNVVLSHRSVSPLQPEQEAHNLANHLRHSYGSRTGGRVAGLSGVIREIRTLWHEPLQGLKHLWLKVERTLQLVTTRSPKTSKHHRSRFSRPLSVVEAVLWVGGGVIARVALNLALAAFPYLWTLAVISITAATAYALYQATLAPKPDLAIASRLLLALGGLVVGGGFGG